MRIALLKASGEIEWIDRPGSTRTKLAELQAWVGGYIERVPMPETFDGNLWANEEGLLDNEPVLNVNASTLMRREWETFVRSEGRDPAEHLDYDMMVLVGDCVWVHGDKDDEED